MYLTFSPRPLQDSSLDIGKDLASLESFALKAYDLSCPESNFDVARISDTCIAFPLFNRGHCAAPRFSKTAKHQIPQDVQETYRSTLQTLIILFQATEKNV